MSQTVLWRDRPSHAEIPSQTATPDAAVEIIYHINSDYTLTTMHLARNSKHTPPKTMIIVHWYPSEGGAIVLLREKRYLPITYSFTSSPVLPYTQHTPQATRHCSCRLHNMNPAAQHNEPTRACAASRLSRPAARLPPSTLTASIRCSSPNHCISIPNELTHWRSHICMRQQPQYTPIMPKKYTHINTLTQ